MKAFLVLFLISTVAFGMGSRQPETPVPAPAPVKADVPDPGQIKIVLNAKGTPAQIARMTKIKPVVERIINSPKFKERVLGAYYNKKLQFVDTDLSNAQVYDALRKGNELGTGNDYVWQLNLSVAKSRCSTLGWTYPTTLEIWFNSCSFDDRQDSGLAGTYCHEYSHKLGFEHAVYDNPARPYSVPYAVGTICAELYPLFL